MTAVMNLSFLFESDLYFLLTSFSNITTFLYNL